MKTYMRRTINSDEAAIVENEKTWENDNDKVISASLGGENASGKCLCSQLRKRLRPWERDPSDPSSQERGAEHGMHLTIEWALTIHQDKAKYYGQKSGHSCN